MRTKDTNKLNKIVKYVDAYNIRHGRSPSIRDIAQHISLSAPTTLDYVKELIDQDKLEQDSGVARSLRTKKMFNPKDCKMMSIPLVGCIPCGIPVTAEENVIRNLPFPIWDLDPRQDYFFLEASGESMQGAGISNGDMLLIRKQETANHGDIVVALTEDYETTLKRLMFDDHTKKVILHAENPNYSDYVCDVVYVQGVVVKVIKSFE